MSLSLIGLAVLMMLLHLGDMNVLYDELHNISSAAMKQTQLLMMENIEDRYYGTDNARVKIEDDDTYAGLYIDHLNRLQKSGADYDVEILSVDHEKGLLAVRVTCSFRMLNGQIKAMSCDLLNIVDVCV